jgi:hypothetical protein
MRLSALSKSLLIYMLLVFATSIAASAQNSFNGKFEKIVFGCYARDIKEFEEFARRAKQSGATHINLSNEDLPLAKWEYDTENDPYPSWVFTNIGLLKIATPDALKPYLPQDYAVQVMDILEARCRVLRKYGLKAVLKTFEPQMLPEKVFTDHPLWRGPRVDHPSRSRVARWAPDIDNPDVLKLYGEAVSILLKHCPELEILSLTTNDSGTGLSWSGGLYSGSSGNTFNKYRRTDERILSFFSVIQESAKKSGSNMEIDIYNTREVFPEKISSSLSPGMSVDNLEGPDSKDFQCEVGFVMEYYQALYPVIGIPDPVRFLEELETAYGSQAKRLFVLLGDRFNKDLYFEIYDRFNAGPVNGVLPRLTLLENIAEEKAGKSSSGQLLELWLSLSEIRKPLNLSQNGGYIFYLGSVMQRWLTRPFVPFPEELKPEERDYFRKFQFQAKGEENANDMADLQASRVFAGWSGRFFMTSLMGEIQTSITASENSIGILLKSDLPREQINDLALLDRRLKMLSLLCNNASSAISYQAQLDIVINSGSKPDSRPVEGKPSSWERTLMLETARSEIDNTAMILQLLESGNDFVLDLAPVKELEDIRRLGPDLREQLKKKLKIMNEHWIDYNRIFTTPNL